MMSMQEKAARKEAAGSRLKPRRDLPAELVPSSAHRGFRPTIIL